MSKIIGKISDKGLRITTSILGAGPQGPQGPQGPPGTTDYMALINLPSIESVSLLNDKTFEDLGITPISQEEIVNIL